MKEKRFRLKKDLIIHKGTIFNCIDGMTTEYISNMYSHGFGLTEDSSGELIYGIDPMDTKLQKWFEEISSE
jgi:hypothetical protein